MYPVIVINLTLPTYRIMCVTYVLKNLKLSFKTHKENINELRENVSQYILLRTFFPTNKDTYHYFIHPRFKVSNNLIMGFWKKGFVDAVICHCLNI